MTQPISEKFDWETVDLVWSYQKKIDDAIKGLKKDLLSSNEWLVENREFLLSEGIAQLEKMNKVFKIFDNTLKDNNPHIEKIKELRNLISKEKNRDEIKNLSKRIEEQIEIINNIRKHFKSFKKK